MKLENWRSTPRDSRVLWIVPEAWVESPNGKASNGLGESQHRLLTGLALVRFAGVGAERRVVPFLATEWDSSDDTQWKFSVPTFFDSAGEKISVAVFTEALRDRLEARATPCGTGAPTSDALARMVERTLPGACEGRRYRLLPDAIMASSDAVTFRTLNEAPWLPWLLAQVSLWVGVPERVGEASWGEFRWVQAKASRHRYHRNANFTAFGATPRTKIPSGPVRDVELDVRVVREPGLRAAYVEEGNADLVDGVEATWARYKTSRLVENEDGTWLVAHDVASPAFDCELLARQTGQQWAAVNEAERNTARFLWAQNGLPAMASALPEEVRVALGAQAVVAAMDQGGHGKAGTVPVLAGISLFGFSGTALAALPGSTAKHAAAASVRCSRRRLSVRGARLDEWRAGVWEPGAGWNLASDTSGTPSAMLYGQDYWPVDKR